MSCSPSSLPTKPIIDALREDYYYPTELDVVYNFEPVESFTRETTNANRDQMNPYPVTYPIVDDDSENKTVGTNYLVPQVEDMQ